MPMKIALYGGTFNPPHFGHVRLLEAFCREIAFDKVLIVPDKRPVHKICEDLALDSERLDMCRLAFPDPQYEVSDMEITRPSDSYTVYTVRALDAQYPQAEIFLLMGSDMFLSFHKWYHYRELLERCTLCVAARQNADDLHALRSYAFSKLRIYVQDHTAPHLRFSDIEPLEIRLFRTSRGDPKRRGHTSLSAAGGGSLYTGKGIVWIPNATLNFWMR